MQYALEKNLKEDRLERNPGVSFSSQFIKTPQQGSGTGEQETPVTRLPSCGEVWQMPLMRQIHSRDFQQRRHPTSPCCNAPRYLN
jgi:hypothetical protein